MSYALVYYRYNKLKGIHIEVHGKLIPAEQTVRKLPFLFILIISLLFTYYCYATMLPLEHMVNDRQNYILNFNGNRESPSLGLNVIIAVIHKFGGDFRTLLAVTMFICMSMTLLGYRYFKDVTPTTILLFMSSQCVLSMMVNLKQCYTSAITILFFVLLLQEKKILKEIFILLLILLAITFHPTGYILVPFYFYVRKYNNAKPINKTTLFCCLLLIFFCFQQVTELLMYLIPESVSLYDKINEYFGENNTDEENGRFIVALKGVPIYIITFLALKLKKAQIHFLSNYNSYILCCIFVSCSYILSYYEVWLTRFMYLFLFVIYTFWGMIIKSVPNGRLYNQIIVIITLFTTYRYIYLCGGAW